jgi:hypothetical protein
MPKSPTYKLSVACANETSFSLQSVSAQPRLCTPLDLQAACNNVRIELGTPDTPLIVADLTRYLLTDFFAQAHRSGLYNRQRKLWAALARVTEVTAIRLQEGLFSKRDIAVFDLLCTDAQNKPLILVRLLEPQFRADGDKSTMLLQTAIHRSEKIRSEHSSLVGLVLCWRKPLPSQIKATVRQLTRANDPILRYESLLPGPLGVCLDLVEYELSDGQRETSFCLVHPELPSRS